MKRPTDATGGVVGGLATVQRPVELLAAARVPPQRWPADPRTALRAVGALEPDGEIIHQERRSGRQSRTCRVQGQFKGNRVAGQIRVGDKFAPQRVPPVAQILRGHGLAQRELECGAALAGHGIFQTVLRCRGANARTHPNRPQLEPGNDVVVV